MSRSNPTSSNTHPSTRWIEYNGASDGGSFRHYDKNAIAEDGTVGCNVDLGPKISFLWLDETYSVTGFLEGQGGIYSNEVKDIRAGVLTVKQHKTGNIIAQGSWNKTTAEGEAFIARVKAAGGKFTGNLYIGYKDAEGNLAIGVLQLKGAAYSKWSEFFQKNKKAIQSGAVTVKSHADGKKGAVKFKTPVFEVVPVSEKSNEEAVELDKQLQAYFKEAIAPVAAAPVAAPVAAAPQPVPSIQGFPPSVYAAAPAQQAPPPTEADYAQGIDLDGDDETPF